MWLRPFVNRKLLAIEEARHRKISFQCPFARLGGSEGGRAKRDRQVLWPGKDASIRLCQSTQGLCPPDPQHGLCHRKWTKLIGGISRAIDLIGGTKLALLLPEVKLRTVFQFAATLNELLMASQVQPQFQLRHRPKVAESLPQPRLSQA